MAVWQWYACCQSIPDASSWLDRGNWTWNASIHTPIASLVISDGSQRRRLTGMTQDRASVAGGTIWKRIEVIRAGSADVTVALFFLHSLMKALDLPADSDKDLNLVAHGSCIAFPVHPLRLGVVVDLLLATGTGRVCKFSSEGSSGVSGDLTMLCSSSDTEVVSALFKATERNL